MTAKQSVMSGMRPTGRLHLGNYWGALRNWIALQSKYRCYFAVVDWHMLTTGYEDTRALQDNIREMVLDWLAAGLDPEQCVVFKQSDVPEHAELALLLSMITPLSWLENNPTWKEQLQELSKTKHGKILELTRKPEKELVPMGSPEDAEDADGGDSVTGQEESYGPSGINPTPAIQAASDAIRTHGFLGYPVLQAADILLYRAELVPIGQDQLPHLELSREIARRFNAFYARADKPVLTEPKPLLTKTPKVPGLDARRMSKSYGNAVDLLESPESLNGKAMSMYTDRTKIRKDDKGHPDPCPENPPGCVVFALHKLYSDDWETRGQECREGRIGCVACKKDLVVSMEGPFGAFREARERLAGRKGLVEEILASGAAKAKPVAARTMEEVRRAMRLR